MDPAFTVTVVPVDDAVLVTPAGPMDDSSGPELRRALDLLGQSATVVVDLGAVPFMDLAGLHFLLDLRSHCEDRGGALHTHAWQRQPRRLIASTAEVRLTAEPGTLRDRLRNRVALSRLLAQALADPEDDGSGTGPGAH
ncbi:STAS domain-containing protein [Streptomyces sp. cmx-4-9]|uniref:STAS domain-containing protein n=1 Tax=Streptomyces sp. cmx-4-9 TaxID=2790941 RepID=UPI00397F2FF6